ncbi:MAG: hypothetical protein M0P74_11350 [Syntrophales bacterium]|nr:hypothetical protein [Syntrophales bacterium]
MPTFLYHVPMGLRDYELSPPLRGVGGIIQARWVLGDRRISAIRPRFKASPSRRGNAGSGERGGTPIQAPQWLAKCSQPSFSTTSSLIVEPVF